MKFLFRFLCCLYLFHALPCFAVSTTGFPGVGVDDFKYFVQSEKTDNNPYIYIYTSASILKSSKAQATLLIDWKKAAHLAPASRTSVYPGISTQTKSEYFDFTIWGHLGNYFNRSAEIVELENEIVEIFDAIETINTKYKTLTPKTPGRSFNRQYTITVDRSNFFSVRSASHVKKSEKTTVSPRGKNGVETKKSTPKTSRTKKALLKFHSLAPTHVELNEAIVDRHSKQSEEALQLIDTRITATPLNTQVQTLRNVDSGGTTFLDRVIFFFTEAPGYVRDNPLESLIYLMLLYFFFKIAAMIFLGK